MLMFACTELAWMRWEQTMEEFVIEHHVRLVIIDSIAVFARAEFSHNQTVERQSLLGERYGP